MLRFTPYVVLELAHFARYGSDAFCICRQSDSARRNSVVRQNPAGTPCVPLVAGDQRSALNSYSFFLKVSIFVPFL